MQKLNFLSSFVDYTGSFVSGDTYMGGVIAASASLWDNHSFTGGNDKV